MTIGTTFYIDRKGTKHWGVMARVVAAREGKQPRTERPRIRDRERHLRENMGLTNLDPDFSPYDL